MTRAPEDSNGPTTAAATSRRWWDRTRYNRAMKLARRFHLYLGLFMTPWVFLYGISAFLLNHPDVVSDAPIRVGAGAGGTPRAEDLAATVVGALNAAEPSAGADAAPPYRLVEPEAAEFNRDLMATVRTKDGSYLARIDMADGSIVLRPNAARTPPASPFGKPSVTLPLRPFDEAVKGLPERLKAAGVAAEAAGLRLAPDLAFLMEGKGETWRVTFNGQNGVALARPASYKSPSPAFSRYLILMHVAHTFPARINARWVWAVLVDLMFLSMASWGVTGLLMWWQMKNLRRIGLIVLLLSAVAALLLGIGMHAAFVAEGLS